MKNLSELTCNPDRNEIGKVQFIGFDYQSRGAYYTWVEAFSHTFSTILGVRIKDEDVLYMGNCGISYYYVQTLFLPATRVWIAIPVFHFLNNKIINNRPRSKCPTKEEICLQQESIFLPHKGNRFFIFS